MTGLSKINSIVVSISSIEYVYNHLISMGNKGVEGVALWAGIATEDTFEVKVAIIPEQTCSNLDSGLLYTVSGDELYRINKWIYENKMVLIAQIHSHPGRAYHSETDDKFPIITTVGGISIVIPDFASGEMSINEWAVYRLNNKNKWQSLTNKELTKLIQITK